MAEGAAEEIENLHLRTTFEKFFSAWLRREMSLRPQMTITWEIDDSFYIQSSPEIFFQVAWNVIRNSIKYTYFEDETGKVRIDAIKGLDGLIYLRVKDTGPGISKDAQELIGAFQFRGDMENTVSGQGVGLWGTYKLIQQIGGRIEFESKPQQGTLFSLGFLEGKND